MFSAHILLWSKKKSKRVQIHNLKWSKIKSTNLQAFQWERCALFWKAIVWGTLPEIEKSSWETERRREVGEYGKYSTYVHCKVRTSSQLSRKGNGGKNTQRAGKCLWPGCMWPIDHRLNTPALKALVYLLLIQKMVFMYSNEMSFYHSLKMLPGVFWQIAFIFILFMQEQAKKPLMKLR